MLKVISNVTRRLSELLNLLPSWIFWLRSFNSRQPFEAYLSAIRDRSLTQMTSSHTFTRFAMRFAITMEASVPHLVLWASTQATGDASGFSPTRSSLNKVVIVANIRMVPGRQLPKSWMRLESLRANGSSPSRGQCDKQSGGHNLCERGEGRSQQPCLRIVSYSMLTYLALRMRLWGQTIRPDRRCRSCSVSLLLRGVRFSLRKRNWSTVVVSESARR